MNQEGMTQPHNNTMMLLLPVSSGHSNQTLEDQSQSEAKYRIADNLLGTTEVPRH